MTKTPEDVGTLALLAASYACDYRDSPSKTNGVPNSYLVYSVAYDAFLAGYRAARDQVADVSKVMFCVYCNDMHKGDCAPGKGKNHPALVKHEWISVKDRLPEMNELCVVNTEWRGVVTATYGNESWIFDEGQGYSEKALRYASHWQPLPAPPKEEE